jgi:cellulose synthase/poly-beta-1,6-N-acetylglucosamine synthase-like glycosyltransferase
MILVAVALGLIYMGLIGYFFYGWVHLKEFIPESSPSVAVSVIIAMRNEENNIKHLLSDLQLQDYPPQNTEIIVVDDHSSDTSCEVVKSFRNITLIQLAGIANGKKAALNVAMDAAKGNLLIITDADCRVQKQWVRTLAAYFEKEHPAMILAPVLGDNGSYFKRLLNLELLSLTGSTAGAASIGHPVMSNGANMAFARESLPYIRHVYQNTAIRSGDDMFAMMELQKHFPGRVLFLKAGQAAVSTQLPDNLRAFFQQRRRWAGKAPFYSDPWVITTAAIVFLTNMGLLTELCWGFVSGAWLPFVVLLGLKSLVDFYFLQSVSSFFGLKRLLVWFPVVQSFYFLYVVLTVLLALVPVNHWKGRNMNH